MYTGPFGPFQMSHENRMCSYARLWGGNMEENTFLLCAKIDYSELHEISP